MEAWRWVCGRGWVLQHTWRWQCVFVCVMDVYVAVD